MYSSEVKRDGLNDKYILGFPGKDAQIGSLNATGIQIVSAELISWLMLGLTRRLDSR
jgi:hypothetical protein